MKETITTIRTFGAFALRPVVAVAVLALLIGTAPAQAAGRNNNPRIAPINSNPHGHTYAEWAGAWWQWAYSFPAGEDTNPVQDPTGALAELGDQGPVWFLAGSFGTTVERTCTIPAGKALFLPIINSAWINVPELGDNPWSDEQQAFALSFLAPFIDNASNLSCEIDGVPVSNLTDYRVQTAEDGEYMVTFPEGGLWAPTLGAGNYGPVVDDGIYLMVAPLQHGQHTIHVTAASADSWAGNFALDVTYHITVE